MDRNAVLKAARKQGWTVEKTRNNHLKLTNPEGQVYFTGSTPSDQRGVRNLVSDLRKMGLEYPTNSGKRKGRQ